MRRRDFSTLPQDTTNTYTRLSQGFTLLEIMVAVLIFSFGLLGMSGMHITAIRMNAAAHLTTQLATVAQEQMEDLLVQPYDAPIFTDTEPLVGRATTYCVLYPREGLKPCKTTAPSLSQGLRPYCRITQQSDNGAECSDRAFPPPTSGYKILWKVDKDKTNLLAHITLEVLRKAEGRQQPKGFALAFAKTKL